MILYAMERDRYLTVLQQSRHDIKYLKSSQKILAEDFKKGKASVIILKCQAKFSSDWITRLRTQSTSLQNQIASLNHRLSTLEKSPTRQHRYERPAGSNRHADRVAKHPTIKSPRVERGFQPVAHRLRSRKVCHIDGRYYTLHELTLSHQILASELTSL